MLSTSYTSNIYQVSLTINEHILKNNHTSLIRITF